MKITNQESPKSRPNNTNINNTDFSDTEIISYPIGDEPVEGWAADNTIKNIGKDLAFEKAMSDLAIHVSEVEVTKEWESMVERCGGIDELRKILLDTQGNEDSLKINIKKGILQQKAIKHFSASVSPSEDNTDFQMEEGARLYEQYIKEYEEKVVIKIY